MLKKKSILYVFILTLLLSGLLFYWYKAEQSGVNNRTNESEQAVTLTQDEASAGNKGNAENESLFSKTDENDFSIAINEITFTEIAEGFHKANTALEKKVSIDTAREHNLYYYKDWTNDLDAFCQPSELDRDNYSENLLWIMEYKVEFCDGYRPTTLFSELDASQLIEKYDDTYQDRNYSDILEIYSNGGIKSIQDVKALIEESKTAIELNNITNLYRSLLSEEGIYAWDISNELNLPPSVNPVEIQNAALHLIKCNKFGCGPSNIETMNACQLTAICSPGWSYEDILYSLLNPIELEKTQLLVSILISES